MSIPEQFNRTQLLFGAAAMEKLLGSRVAVFGVGGVGGHCIEALARSGVGCLEIVDSDIVVLTNLNRQLIATQKTIGRPKVEVMTERIREINPDCQVIAHQCFFLPENASDFDFTAYDYVVDAVDTVSAKIAIVMAAKEAGVPVISSMGAGNKINPAMFEVADIYKTSVDPLARVMRKAMKDRGVKKLKVVYSKELPLTPQLTDLDKVETKGTAQRIAPGSNAFTPSVVGLIIAGEVIKDLIGLHNA